jgi:hypothetical protein
MKEVRAVVIGLVIVILVAVAWSSFSRPARQFHRIGDFTLEVRKHEGDASKHLKVRIPMSVLARVASFAPLQEVGGNWKAEWGDGDITGKDILEAASQSAPGKPGVIERNGNRIEVTADGSALDILIKDNWDKTVKLRLPRVLVEGFADRRRISIQELLKRLDEMGPGDVVKVEDGDNEVTITAEAKGEKW